MSEPSAPQRQGSQASDEAESVDRPDSSPEAPARWNPLTRIAFRFCFAYFALFCLTFAQIIWVFVGVAAELLPDDAVAWQMLELRPLLRWVGRNVFGTHADLVMNGSGDQTLIWVMVFLLLVAAAVITVTWWVLDRRRAEYTRLWTWFVLVMRMCLGGQLLFYGFAKLFPLQMPYPSLLTQLTPYGQQGMFTVLWNQVGSSPVYQILLGAAEVTAGLLVFIPRTATAGALLSLVSMSLVWIFNMTFDVPVKILSFHLLLLSLVVLVPQARRLANFLVLERPTEPATQPSPFRARRAKRIAAAVQVALAAWVLFGCLQFSLDAWSKEGFDAPKPPLYGIWDVTEFVADGHPVPPLITDEIRWRRLVFDQSQTTYQRMDDTFVPVAAQVDPEAHSVALSGLSPAGDAPPVQLAKFTYDRPDAERLSLRGELGGRPVTIELKRLDSDAFPLNRTKFHWVQDAPHP